MKKFLFYIIPMLSIIMILICVNIYFINRVYPRKLIEAIDNNDMEEFTKLLEEEGNIDNRPFLWGVDRVNYHPLHYACSEGKIENVIKLVDAGANLNNKKATNNKTPLMCALAYNNNEQKFAIVKYLVEHGADIENASAIGQFILEVSRKNNELILQYLIEERNVDLNLIDIGCRAFSSGILYIEAESKPEKMGSFILWRNSKSILGK